VRSSHKRQIKRSAKGLAIVEEFEKRAQAERERARKAEIKSRKEIWLR
jgi:hypothetical protein